MTTRSRGNRTPVIFGEILFDCFPDGSRIAGGAPFNVAWHLQGFGLAPIFVSRIGADDAGDEIRHLARDWGLDCRAIQTDAAHPTGRVQVQLHDGQPKYEILAAQAYDFIDPDQALSALADTEPGLLYHGSLVARSALGEAGLRRVVAGLDCPVFVDVNLRPPWWQADQIPRLLQQATYAKLNDDELLALAPGSEPVALVALAEEFRVQHRLDQLILTQGAKGAQLLTASRRFGGEPTADTEVVDTVGAGDAFSAVCILGLLEQWPQEQMLRRALAFAAHICTQRGATCHDRTLYEDYRQRWRHSD